MRTFNIIIVRSFGDKLITVMTVSSALRRTGLSSTSNYRRGLQSIKHGFQPTAL